MQSVNWWLMVLAFLLGLVLTFFLVVRRVKREVPEYATLGAGAGAAGAAGGIATAKLTGKAGVADDDVATTKVPTVEADADDAATRRVPKIDVEEPYGAGSARVAAGAAAPSGYDIKGNEDSMLYHTPDSPAYKRTIAEIWFRDVPTAEAAGFHRWDSGKSQRETR
jgi:uncharacterized membrane protein ArfC